MKETAATGNSENWKFKTWVLVGMGGAIGWWVFLSHCKVFPYLGSWMELLLRCAAVGCFLMSFSSMGKDMDTIIEKWVNRNGYKAAHTLRADKERAAKWILAPIWIWWLPTLLMFMDMIAGRFVF